MVAHLAAAWLRPAPRQGGWDFLPVVCAMVLLMSARAAGVRPRWWGGIVAFAGGLPCAALASRFGAWAVLVIASLVFLVGVPAARARRPG
jgi:hypothetical protein